MGATLHCGLHYSEEDYLFFFLSFFFCFFFLTWTIFKVFIEFVTVLILFYALVFLAMRHWGSWLPEPAPWALEGKALTTGSPGKSEDLLFLTLSVPLSAVGQNITYGACCSRYTIPSFSFLWVIQFSKNSFLCESELVTFLQKER